MKNPTYGLQEWELQYYLHKENLPDDVREPVEKFIEMYHFFHDVCEASSARLAPRLHALMERHYPATAGATHPAQTDYAHKVNTVHTHGLARQLRNLLNQQRAGVNLKEHYPRMEEWRVFYCRASSPSLVTDADRNRYVYPDDAAWERHKAEENRLLRVIHEERERHKDEYLELVQPVMMEYLPELANLEGDYWVLLAVALRDSYEEWSTCCEHLAVAIEHGLPAESVNWEQERFSKALRDKWKR